MAILKTFLCLFNTRTGSLISGCYTLVISLMCLVYYLFRYVGHKLVEDSTEYKGIVFVGFVLYGFMIISSLVVIPGVQLDKRYLLLPWIYIIILVILYDTGSVALLTTVHMEREKTLHAWEIVWVFFYLFRLAANCYCFTCVVSQYQELSDGRGTYDYLYKPHRRRTRFQDGSYFDIDTVDLPFGVHLPPYTSENDRENSPPMYDQIFPEPVQQTTEADVNCVERNYIDIHINPNSETLEYNSEETAPVNVEQLCHIDGACGCFRDPIVLRNGNLTIENLPENYRDVQIYNYFQPTNHESECGSVRSHRGPQCYEVTVNVEWI